MKRSRMICFVAGHSRLAAATAVVGVIATLVAVLASSTATAQGQSATKRVIIVFKNQERSLVPTRAVEPRRRAVIAGLQAPLRSQLTSSGARDVQSYTVVNAISATVSPSEESQLKSNSTVQEVIPDQLIYLGATHLRAAPNAGGQAPSGGMTPPNVCAPNGKVQLNPEALETIGADSDSPGIRATSGSRASPPGRAWSGSTSSARAEKRSTPASWRRSTTPSPPTTSTCSTSRSVRTPFPRTPVTWTSIGRRTTRPSPPEQPSSSRPATPRRQTQSARPRTTLP